MMNEKDRKWLFDESLLPHHKRELEDLVTHLGWPLSSKVRYASSIITRSEIQLFGCGSPRFAFRLYFEEIDGFINVRRLNTLSAEIRVRAHVVPGPAGSIHELSRQEIKNLLTDPNQSCIADCLLPRPRINHTRFHLITAHLSSAYGETATLIDIPEYAGTPFVKNISMGGGLCAQACCFMAAAILHKFVRGLHGLGEITALAHSTRQRKLKMSGLSTRLMIRYFSRVGLTMTEQFVKPNLTGPANRITSANTEEFETAVRAYCLSNMPLIVPVDMGRLWGFFSLNPNKPREEKENIYAQNGFKLKTSTSFDRTKPKQHCFVVVGCERRAKLGEGSIIFNDPGHHPFMWAKPKQIGQAGTYESRETETIQPFNFWSVTPSAVKMPLAAFKSPSSSIVLPDGLMFLAKNYRKIYHPNHSLNQKTAYLLQQIKSFGTTSLSSPLPEDENIRSQFRAQLVNIGRHIMDNYSWSDEHWVWLEIMEDRIWLWDAETEPVPEEPRECLITVLIRNGNSFSVNWPEGFEIDPT